MAIQTHTIKLYDNDEMSLSLMFDSMCKATSWASYTAFDSKLRHWSKLQKVAYQNLRHGYNLSAVQATAIIKVVSDYYEANGLKEHHDFSGSVVCFKHTFAKPGEVLIYGKRYSYSCQPGIHIPRQPKQGRIVKRGNEFFLYQPIHVEEKKEYIPRSWLGCDLGVKNIVTTSDGDIFDGDDVWEKREKYRKLRLRLLNVGTKSAKRLFKKIKNKESRYAKDVDHRISKFLVTKAKRQQCGIALEDLKGIMSNVTVRKAQRSRHMSWSFFRLRSFVEYKALIAGVPVVVVNAYNTSRTCPECGCIDKRNRKSQALFKCIKCGFSGHADTVAAGNIARRAAGNQPYAVPVVLQAQ